MSLEEDETRERILILISITNTADAFDVEIRYQKYWSKYCCRYYDPAKDSKTHILKSRTSEIKSMLLNYEKKVTYRDEHLNGCFMVLKYFHKIMNSIRVT